MKMKNCAVAVCDLSDTERNTKGSLVLATASDWMIQEDFRQTSVLANTCFRFQKMEKKAIEAVSKRNQEVKDQLNSIPKGRAKSGRPWKVNRMARSSEIKKVKSLKSSWAEKMKKKAEEQSVKSFEKQLKDERAAKLELQRQRQNEHKQRKLENEKKSEVVQTIKNTAKIKRMKKKQLRLLAKR
ncbi:Coiled-coil domain-containing protein 86 [Mizuhopecten yessoensis]|uniref:Coiled-coil domain-containing protein 86 n=2 Tax=Mizuhopecten yessoensis TaxID=6573 RepID=A0A210Q7V8_MIZYE|nr:Coiled-coil domain-containing protein 86 [Mizuhopecten yessoensis]